MNKSIIKQLIKIQVSIAEAQNNIEVDENNVNEKGEIFGRLTDIIHEINEMIELLEDNTQQTE